MNEEALKRVVDRTVAADGGVGEGEEEGEHEEKESMLRNWITNFCQGMLAVWNCSIHLLLSVLYKLGNKNKIQVL